MPRQLGLYERPVPVSPGRHRSWSLRAEPDYRFAAQLNAIAVMTAEFAEAARTLPIVFSVEQEVAMPVVVVGLENGRNSLVDAEGGWTGSFIPASIRRYPFVLSKTPNDTTMTLCVDEAFVGLDPTGATGDRLFDVDDGHSPRLSKAIGFAATLQQEHARTQAFAQRLHTLGLLEPAKLTITTSDGSVRHLTGFYHVARARLAATPDADLKALLVSGELELIFLHLQSLGSFETLARALVAEAPKPSEPTTFESSGKPKARRRPS